MTVPAWPAQPKIHEVPTWSWLRAWSEKLGHAVTLSNLPETVVQTEFQYFDAVWLMGVWERSPQAREIAREHPDLQAEYRNALPDVTTTDIVGSPYAIHRYEVDQHLGGPEGLKRFRAVLAKYKIKLILDYVPNHTALDHPWTSSRPEIYVSACKEQLQQRPQDFFMAGGKILAHGRDPYFPPWTDSAQINGFSAQARQAAIETLCTIAGMADGVRCDMAMLLLTEIFRQTWGDLAGASLPQEFWVEVISALRRDFPEFLFIAEAYWDKEWELQQQGFDYCYDKRLYDRLVRESAETIRLHLQAEWDYQRKLLRFIENHDEPRASAVLGDSRSRAAAILVLTLPGASLTYSGQMSGATVKLPIQLGRGPQEPRNASLEVFYARLLAAAAISKNAEATWSLAEINPLGSASSNAYLAYHWKTPTTLRLVVVNYSFHRAKAQIRLKNYHYGEGMWMFNDLLGGKNYLYSALDLDQNGLFVDLPAWGGHLFEVSKAG